MTRFKSAVYLSKYKKLTSFMIPFLSFAFNNRQVLVSSDRLSYHFDQASLAPLNDIIDPLFLLTTLPTFSGHDVTLH